MSAHFGAVAGATVSAGLADLADRVREITVRVTDGGGQGAGVVWCADGLVISNAHVVRGAGARVELHDGRELDARVVARDAARDLVALRVETGGLHAARVGDTGALRPGELVVALGSPLGWKGALSWGVVHAVERFGSTGVVRWVRTDLDLAPGNSGGPLVDAAGRLVGINSRVEGRAGLALPGSAVEAFLGRAGATPALGLSVRPVEVSGLPNRHAGLLVLRVDTGSPAAHAGILPGDVVLAIGDAAVREISDLPVVANEVAPGTPIALETLRAGRRIRLALAGAAAAA